MLTVRQIAQPRSKEEALPGLPMVRMGAPLCRKITRHVLKSGINTVVQQQGKYRIRNVPDTDWLVSDEAVPGLPGVGMVLSQLRNDSLCIAKVWQAHQNISAARECYHR